MAASGPRLRVDKAVAARFIRAYCVPGSGSDRKALWGDEEEEEDKVNETENSGRSVYDANVDSDTYTEEQETYGGDDFYDDEWQEQADDVTTRLDNDSESDDLLFNTVGVSSSHTKRASSHTKRASSLVVEKRSRVSTNSSDGVNTSTTSFGVCDTVAFAEQSMCPGVRLPTVIVHESSPSPADARKLGSPLFSLGSAVFYRADKDTVLCYLCKPTPIVIPGVHTDRQLARQYARRISLQALMQKCSSFGGLTQPPPFWGEHLQEIRLHASQQKQLRQRHQQRQRWIGDRRLVA